MQGLNQSGEEEYILAMRAAADRQTTDTWRERRSEPLTSGHPLLSTQRRKTKTKGLIPMTNDHMAKTLASLVPDEIIYDVNDYSNRFYDVCLLFGDVSGFTELCEMYNKTGKGGPSRLTQVLNGYIGSMVQEILSHNGDVLKFSGDAFLAMWKSGAVASMQDCVHEAIDTALVIQKTFGTYETDVGVFLRVKLAVSAGHVVFSIIGDAQMSHYVVVGQPVLDVKSAEKHAVAGEIIVAASAWYYVSPNEYISQYIGGLCTRITGVGPSWRPVHRNIDRFQKQDDDNEDSYFGRKSAMKLEDDVGSTTKLEQIESRKQNKNDEISLRPSVTYASKMNLTNDLRKYIIPPIMRGIDLDEPLEYLTEMRQIVIGFINVVPTKMDLAESVEAIDTIYKIICHVVQQKNGCVNKVSLFDKDLMFVLLFGLRGYKSELESQIALRCAAECYQKISELEQAASTSIAITTGATYCGVVGHTLRREYTVISLTVNKAARLMVAYPDKVTCDRETFLHSKLEAKNFILQEAKALKGITNVGPVYEFKEQEFAVNKLEMNPFPLLGRSDEIKLYIKILGECIEARAQRDGPQTMQQLNHHNTLLIRGEARIGKTRLLDELVYSTPTNIPVNRFTLTKNDSKVPFIALQRIFSMPLGLKDLNSSNDRAAKLKLRLSTLPVQDFLCALNKVFNVDFEKSQAYMTLNRQQKIVALEKMIKQLCYISFRTFWIIAIDDIQYFDEESWHYLPILIQLDIVFMLMTIDEHVELTAATQTVLANRRVRTLDLMPVDKWYHAGLACQILEVHAIPPELEKVIHTRSNGNPGWIESFLISLIQAGGLLLREFPRAEVNELGLVTPPIDMLIRLSMEEVKKMETHFDPEQMSPVSSQEKITDSWKMFQCSYRDSQVNILKEKIRDKHLKTTNYIPACTIAPNFSLEEIDPELSMNVMIIKMFDSLTSYEQLLLKCSSVLGEYFPRDMLIYIMASKEPRPFAIAVQKLFELRVLGCARGDFLQGDANMVFTQRLINPNQDVGVKCECRGNKIHETCKDLPKYASCGYLRFRVPMFHTTTYDLLTDNQKKEFHNRAIRYIEKETKRCRACGNGYFVRILGNKQDDGFTRRRKKSSYLSRSQSSSVINSRTQSSDSSALSAHRISGVDYTTLMAKSLHRTDTRNTTFDMPQATRDHSQIRYCLGLNMIRKLKDSVSLTRTFSYADFSTCQCPLILNTMYTQMLEHCKGAGLTNKMMDAMLEYAYICILSYNIPQALKILDDSIEIVGLMGKDQSDEEALWKVPLQKGKIYTLIGHARLELGQLEEVYTCLTQALQYYGYSFPSNHFIIKLRTINFEMKERFAMYFFPSWFGTTVDGYQAEFYDNLSECLSLICRLFKEVQMWDEAELAASWSLSKSLGSDSDFFGLCMAYSNMLEVAHYQGKTNLCIALEVHALKLCHRKKSSIESQELKAVCNLYGAIFCSRVLRSAVEHAIHIGYIMLRICATVHAIQTSLKVLPLIIQALLIRSKVSEAATMLMELEYCAEEDTDNSAKTWYFSLCVGFQLETAYTMTPFKICEKFYQMEGDTLISIRDTDAERRFYVVMWLWYVRNEEWEAATIWQTKACGFPLIKSDDSLNNVITSLYLLEGLLLFVVGKIDRRNLQAIGKAFDEIQLLLRAIARAARIARIIQPRYYHLKAYYKFLKNEETKAFNLLEKAKKVAEKEGNAYEILWVEHSEKAWKNNLSGILIDFWKEHCEPDNLMDFHEADLNEGKIGFFTLPTPLYY